MIKKKICVITGTRAEYGLLRPLMEKINKDEELELQIIATAMHLSHEFGLTYKEIEKDGFEIDEKIEMLLGSDTAIGISKSMGLAIISFSETLNRLKPDLVIILGDRYEILMAASAAMIAKIPIVHLHGGETTEGAFDESIRHSITKMSFLHFTSTEEYKKRVIQLGEDPSRVFNVGAIGVENIKKLNIMEKEQVEKEFNFKLDKPYAMVTFHPVTLEESTSEEQFKELLKAIDSFKDMKFVITKANSDSDGRIINSLIDEYVEKNKDRCVQFVSMSQIKYLSAMKHSSMVVGNSSSGIIETPSFNIPTINIGDRQKGRVQATTVINCEPVAEKIIDAMNKGLSKEFKENIKDAINPYGDGNTSDKIMKEIKKTLSEPISLKKKFFDL